MSTTEQDLTTISGQIERIINAKTAISEAISNKGVEVPSTVAIDEMATYINQISTGSGLISELPVKIVQGGTGATTAGDGLLNLSHGYIQASSTTENDETNDLVLIAPEVLLAADTSEDTDSTATPFINLDENGLMLGDTSISLMTVDGDTLEIRNDTGVIFEATQDSLAIKQPLLILEELIQDGQSYFDKAVHIASDLTLDGNLVGGIIDGGTWDE